MNIKRMITACLLTTILAFAGTAQAQIFPKIGVKGGLNYSTFNNTDNVEYKPGFVGGLFLKMKVPVSPMYVQPEVLYAQYGAGIDQSDASFRVNYIQVPVLLKFAFDTPGVKPNVFFGPYAGFNVKYEIKNSDGAINLDDQAKDTDFGVVVGAGVDINRFSIGLRYTAGLTNVANDNFNDEAKNGAFGLTVGVHL
jgi:opacity protein-like surface antigen